MTTDRKDAQPWDKLSCTLIGLGRQIAQASLKPQDTLCDGCWGIRSECGGRSRTDVAR